MAPLPRPVRAAAAVAAPPADAASVRPPALYLLHCHLAGQKPGVGREELQQLRQQLKAMEKVAKKALWFTTMEAEDGEHVLMVGAWACGAT